VNTSGHAVTCQDMFLCIRIYLGCELCRNTFYHNLTFFSALKMCVYLMSRVVLRMDLEDGVNITVQELVQSILQEEELGVPRVAANIFTLWMCSSLMGNNFMTSYTQYKTWWLIILLCFLSFSGSYIYFHFSCQGICIES
jgi:hypothetical protein